jgi:hypothetical protein
VCEVAYNCDCEIGVFSVVAVVCKVAYYCDSEICVRRRVFCRGIQIKVARELALPKEQHKRVTQMNVTRAVALPTGTRRFGRRETLGCGAPVASWRGCRNNYCPAR